MRKNRISLPGALVLAFVILIYVFSQQGLIQFAGTAATWKVPQNETKTVNIITTGKPLWHVIPRLLLTGR